MISSVQASQIASGSALSIQSGTVVLQVGGPPLGQPDLTHGSELEKATARACVIGCESSGLVAIVAAAPGSNGSLGHDAPSNQSEQQQPQQAPACTCTASPGPAGSAPSGSGPVGINSALYKFAAPALERPQLPTSVLGRPMAFFDPLERPG
jgi:hypothetical protein